MTCKFCDRPTDPDSHDLCTKHLDLAILADSLLKMGQPVTVETIRRLVAHCRKNGGVISLEVDEVEALMAGPFATDYEVRI